MPLEVVRALARVKRAAATANLALGLLPEDRAAAIRAAATEVLEGRHDAQFPLSVWQTGSGTQTNMNVNEVIANRASELLGGPRGEGRLVHPNDDVNRGQSSNDVFPTAMHVAAVLSVAERLLPALAGLRSSLDRKANELGDIVKLGRTHLQDATPLTLGQELSGHVAQLAQCEAQVRATLPGLHELSIGGTAVGTGLGAHPELGPRVAALLAAETGHPFVVAPNLFAALASHEALVFAHGALKTLAAALMKIGNDVRWLASGPRAGLGELSLPENEPGSSIMPGKVNPTQVEALTMVVCRVMGNDVTVGLAGSQGSLELNVYKPVLAHAFLESAQLLADAMTSFTEHCVVGMTANRSRIAHHVASSLMLVTALSPHVGYDVAARIARLAHQEGLTLREAALRDGAVTAAEFDAWVRPEEMTGPRGPAGSAA
jgi:fumarate hydratase class II